MTTDSKGKTNKARGEETRKKVLEVGLRLFAINGFNGVSMRSLTSEADVNLATVGYHFGGKQGLYEAILKEIASVGDRVLPGMAAVDGALEDYKSGKLTKEELVAWFFKFMMHGMLDDPEKENMWGVMLISRELAAPSESYELLNDELFTPSIDAMNKLLAVVMPEATFVETMAVGSALVGIVLKFIGHKAFSDRVGWEEMTPDRVEELTKILCKRAVAFVCC